MWVRGQWRKRYGSDKSILLLSHTIYNLFSLISEYVCKFYAEPVTYLKCMRILGTEVLVS